MKKSQTEEARLELILKNFLSPALSFFKVSYILYKNDRRLSSLRRISNSRRKAEAPGL